MHSGSYTGNEQLMNEPEGRESRETSSGFCTSRTVTGCLAGWAVGLGRGGEAGGIQEAGSAWLRLLAGVRTPHERGTQEKGKVPHLHPLTLNILHCELAHTLIKTIFPKNLL